MQRIAGATTIFVAIILPFLCFFGAKSCATLDRTTVPDTFAMQNLSDWLRVELSRDDAGTIATNSAPFPETPARAGRIFVTLYQKDAPGLRPGIPHWIQATAAGKTVRECFAAAVTAIRSDNCYRLLGTLPAENRRALLAKMAIRVDLLQDAKPLPRFLPLARDISLFYGVDGLEVSAGNRSWWLLPDEPVEAGLRQRTMAGADYGADFGAISSYLNRKYGAPFRPDFAPHALRRFATVAWVEQGRGAGVTPVFRANNLIESKAVDRNTLARAIDAAADSLARTIQPDGRFLYQIYPAENRTDQGGYDATRHGGACCILYQTATLRNRPELATAADRALAWLLTNVPASERDGLSGTSLYPVGMTALALTARRAATGDTRYDNRLAALVDEILARQDKSGLFCEYRPTVAKTKNKLAIPYAPGEAMLALAAARAIREDARIMPAIRRGLARLAGDVWNFFPDKLFYGFFSWEMQVIAKAARELAAPELEDFCYRQADALILRQYPGRPEMHPLQADFAGGFEQSVFNVPKSAHAGARGEGILAAWKLAMLRGDTNRARRYRDALRAMTLFIVNQQVRTDNSWYYRNPEQALGAIRYTPVFHELRIDHTQHCLAVLNGALEGNMFP